MKRYINNYCMYFISGGAFSLLIPKLTKSRIIIPLQRNVRDSLVYATHYLPGILESIPMQKIFKVSLF